MTQREARLRSVLQQQGEASVALLSVEMGVSEMTLRRDLDRLERTGFVRRTHGGAVLAERLGFAFDFSSRRLVKPGCAVLLDAGTTTLQLAEILSDAENLVVVTPSLAVASALQFSEGVKTILLGGVLRRGTPDLTGEVAEAALGMLAVDIAFQGADGIGLDGSLYTGDLGTARLDQRIRERAARTYVLADSTKVGRTALARHGSLREMSGWITDRGIQAEHLKALRKLGVPITIVKA